MNALIQMKKKTTIDTKMKKGNLSFFFLLFVLIPFFRFQSKA